MRRSSFAAALAAPLLVALVPAGPSNAVPTPATSPTAPASLEARAGTGVARWAAAPSTVDPGSPFVGTVAVSGGRRPVRLQRRVDGAWRTVADARSTASGRATLRWTTPSRTAAVRLRAVAPRSGDHPAVSTPVRVVRVHGSRAGTGDAESSLLRDVLTLVNRVRSRGHTCASAHYSPRPAVRLDARLGRAADKYARLMATRDFFSHDAPDGSSPGDRISAEGYRWSSYGENIAAGYSTAATVVQGWLESEGHCRNLMGDYTEIGLGYAYDADSSYGAYWVQDFARPQ